MKKIMVGIVGILIIISIIGGLPIIFDKYFIGNSVKSNISNSDWVSFMGSYLGSIIGIIGTIIAVYLTIKFTEKKELEDIEIYFEYIFGKNKQNEQKICNELLNNIMYDKEYFEKIDSNFYNENFLKILKLKKTYNKILKIYSLQKEIEVAVDKRNISGFMGHLRIKSFEELKEILEESSIEVLSKEENKGLKSGVEDNFKIILKIDEILQAISVLIDCNDEKTIDNYFKSKKDKDLEREIKEYLKKHKKSLDRLKNLMYLFERKTIKLNLSMYGKKGLIINELLTKTFRSLKEIIILSTKVEEYLKKIKQY